MAVFLHDSYYVLCILRSYLALFYLSEVCISETQQFFIFYFFFYNHFSSSCMLFTMASMQYMCINNVYSNQMCKLKQCVRQCDGAAGWYSKLPKWHEKHGLGMRLQHYNVVQGEYSQ